MAIEESELRRIAGKIVKRGASAHMMIGHTQHIYEICAAFLELSSTAGVDDPKPPAPKKPAAAKKAARK